MNKLLTLAVIGAGIWAATRLYRIKQTQQLMDSVKQPIPPGAVPTGRVAQTTTGGAPGEEVVGYGIRDFMEVRLPSGHAQWLEIKVKNPVGG